MKYALNRIILSQIISSFLEKPILKLEESDSFQPYNEPCLLKLEANGNKADWLQIFEKCKILSILGMNLQSVNF